MEVGGDPGVSTKDDRPVVPFLELVGAQLEEMSEGYARLALTLQEQHLNPHGVMHGGVATTLMDSAAATALVSLRGDKWRTQASIEMNAAFLAPARSGDEIIAEGRIIKLGRSIAFAEAEVRRRADNELIARGRVTFAISTRRV
jgi:uncharacterized protein (TIGR00369 family)